MKLTKRKGFNFFRSYYDVFNMIESDSDKLKFISALLDRQFLGIKPEDLKGQANFAWVSQVNSIDSQIKGWENKTELTLTPTQGGGNTPTEQLEEKGKGKEEEKGKEQSLIEKNDLIKSEILDGGIWIESQLKVHSSLSKESFAETFEVFWLQNYEGHILENTPRKQSDIKRHFSNTIKKLSLTPTNKKSYVEQLTDKI